MSALVRRALMQAAKRRTVGDQYFSNVVLLMHMEDTGLTDVKGHVGSDVLSPVVRSTATAKSGVSSAYFNGSAARRLASVNADFDFGSGDFTAEAWVNISSMASGFFPIFSNWLTVGQYRWYLNYYPSSGLVMQASFDGTNAITLSQGAETYILNEWIHVAVTREGNTFRIFERGILKGSLTASGAIFNGTQYVYLGGYLASVYHGNGYIDEVRITRGITRYTATFTPPAAPFPDF